MVHAVTTRIASSTRFGSALSGGCVALAACCRSPWRSPRNRSTPAVIPAPAKVERLDGRFVVTSRTRISGGDTAEGLSVAAYFADLVRRSHGWSLPIDRAAEATDAAPRIAFRLGESADTSSPRGLRRVRCPRGRHGVGTRPPGAAVRRGDALAVDGGRVGGSRRGARHAHRRRTTLRLARADARLRAALPVARVHRALHRLDGAAQAERAALAPDRRPGLAARDPQVPAADLDRRLARAGRARRRGGHRSRHRPATRLRRVLHAGHRAAHRAARGRTGCHDRAGDRYAGSRDGDDRGLPCARRQRKRFSHGPGGLGDLPKPVQRRGHDLHFSRGRPARGDGAVPGPVHPRRRRRGRKGPVEELAAGAAADARARNRGRARAAELLRAAHRTLSRRERAAADRLGRDPRRRPRARCHRDVLARDRRSARRGCRGPRCGAFAVARAVLRQPPGHRRHRAARPRSRHRPRNRLSLRPDAAGAAA